MSRVIVQFDTQASCTRRVHRISVVAWRVRCVCVHRCCVRARRRSVYSVYVIAFVRAGIAFVRVGVAFVLAGVAFVHADVAFARAGVVFLRAGGAFVYAGVAFVRTGVVFTACM